MVTEFGFSDKLGRLRYMDNQEEVFLGHSVTQHQNVSEATAQIIDEEIRRLVTEGEQDARRILTEHRDDLEKIAQALLEYETLSGDDIKRLLAGEELHRDDGDEEETPDSSSGASGATSSSNGSRSRASVPTAGKRKPSGMGPEPQPGG